MFFALKGENFDGNKYAEKALELGAKYAVIDDESFKHIPKTILVNNVLETLQKLSTFHRVSLNIPIISLTGSNGKTTTKELINTILSQKYNTTATVGNLNNHIGVPLTLLSMNRETEIGIVEMGANHQKEIEFLCNIARPDYGYVTNFGKAHLEGFGGVKGVIKGKSEMYDYIHRLGKRIFINANDPIQVNKTKKANVYTFGNSVSGTDISINFVEAQPFVSCVFRNLIIQSQLIGEYNFNNISAAIAIGNYFKVKPEEIKTAIENFVPKNNRSQIIIKESNKIILDAYNANPSSMRAALVSFDKQPGNKIAILGDMFELGKEAKLEHQNIASLALSLNINQIFFVGKHFYDSKINSEKSTQCDTFEIFKDEFDFSKIEDTTILIKGSRGMALERVIEIFSK